MVPEKSAGSNRRIGFFPITGDPIHYGHLRGALAVCEVCGLETVYLQVCGDLGGHKPEKSPKHHRQAMARLAVSEFEPKLRYTALGFEPPQIGEEVFIAFTELPEFEGVEQFYYIAGADNLGIVRQRFAENRARLQRPYELVFLTRTGQPLQAPGCRVVECHSPFSSSSIRAGGGAEYLPPVVAEYCRRHRLYGFA